MAGINIPIVSSLGGKGFEQAILQLKQLETNGQKAGFALEKAFLPAIGALAAMAAVGGFAVKAAIEDQESQVQLAQALKNTVSASDETIAATEKMITQMSRASGVADDELRPAFAQLVRGTGSLTKAQEAMSLAMDIQAGTGQDLRSVTDALASAYAGNLKGLKSLSPEITKMIKDGAGLNEVIKVLGSNFKGAADVARKSAQGQLALMSGAFTDMKESIGMALLPALEAVIPYLVMFSDWAANHVNVVIAIGTAIAGIATAIATYVAVQKTANAVMIVATTLNWAMAASETAKNTAATLGVGAAAIAAGLVVAMGALVIFKNKTKDLTTAQIASTDATTRQVTAVSDLKVQVTASARMTQQAIAIIEAQDKATRDAAKGTKELTEAQKRMAERVKNVSAVLNDYITESLNKAKIALSEAKDKFNDLSSEVSKGIKSTFSFGAIVSGAQDKLNKLAETTKDAAQVIADDLSKGLENARDELSKTKATFNDFAKSIAAGIKDSFSFKTASEGPDGFITGLRDQVKAIKEYNDDIKMLLDKGLSEDALKQILAAGSKSGAAIARNLLTGAQDDITGPEGVNALVKSVMETADQLGKNTADRFYGEGVSSAQKYFDGIKSQFDEATAAVNAVQAGTDVTSGFLEGLNSQVESIKTYGEDINTLLQRGISLDALQAVLDAGGESGAAIAHELVLGAQENITGPTGVNALVKSVNDVADRIALAAANKWYGAGVSNAQSYFDGIEAAFDAAQKRLGAKGLTLADLKGIGATFDSAITMPSVTPVTPSRPEVGSGAPGSSVVINVSGVMTNAQTGQAVLDNLREYSSVYGPLNLAIR